MGKIRRHPGSLDIVDDGLVGIVLHERHMLVRRGVKDDLWLKLVKHRFHLFTVGDAPEDKMRCGPRLFPGANQGSEIVQGILTLFNHHHGCRLKIKYLSTQFGTDGPPGSGHQNTFALQ